MNDDGTQSKVIAFLSRPESYGDRVTSVDRCETHGAIVFLAGDYAYKLKRAVRYPYLDYSTINRRHEMCQAELRINRLFSPTLYLSVRPIIRANNGLAIGNAGEEKGAIDWLVVMRRFPQDAILENMRLYGRLTPSIIVKLADCVAYGHVQAARSTMFGGVSAIRNVLDENSAIMRHLYDSPFEPEKVERLIKRADRELQSLADLLETRRESGWVRRCHGDLHLNNILLDGGNPVLFDAIEYSDSFSWIDVLYDLAFLLVDLERHDLTDYSNILLNRYLEKMGDYRGLAALPLFLSCRAAIRAHVIATMSRKVRAPSLERMLYQSKYLLDMAIRYLDPPEKHLIALGGLSGTGKSTLAVALAPRLGRPGTIILRSDIVRKKLWGVDTLSRLPDAAYREEITDKVYAQMLTHAATILRAGYSVILDAVHGKVEQRQQAAAVAKECGGQFSGIWLNAPIAILEERVANRQKDPSDATIDILQRQQESVDAPNDWTIIDSSAQTYSLLPQVVRRLGGLLPATSGC